MNILVGAVVLTAIRVGAVTAAEAPRYSAVVSDLRKASIPVEELRGPGYVAVTPAAARIVAMAFSRDGPDLFWSNPQLTDTNTLKNTPEKLVGGFGGDRLWFAPELDYHWNGAPDWHAFTNYKIPAVMDPGNYELINTDGASIALHARGALVAHGGISTSVGFGVQRIIRMTQPPLPKTDPLMNGVEYVGVETSHWLRLDDTAKIGRMDLWHLLQMPAGSILIVPLNPKATAAERKPLSYGLPGGWTERSDHILWRYGGEAHAKFGLPAAALTGRTAVLRELGAGQWCLIVRQFPTDPKASYGDHPYGVLRDDQVFQAWDGYGFGEMEYHSPVLDAERSPRELKSSDQLWAFGGSAKAIAALSSRLLGVDVTGAMRSNAE